MTKIVSLSVFATVLLLCGIGYAQANVQGACASRTWTIVEVRDGHSAPYLNFKTPDGHQEAFGLTKKQWEGLKAQYGDNVLGLQFCGEFAIVAVKQIVGD